MTVEILSAARAAELEIQRLLWPQKPAALPAAQADALLEAQALLERARLLCAQAAERIEGARLSAEQEGRRAGMSQAAEALVAARAEYGSLMDRAEADMVSLALELARKIVGRHLEQRPEALAQMTAHALGLARGRRIVEVHVHPDALERIEAGAALLAAQVEVPVVFVADASVPPLASHIHTEAGVIEADLDTQIDVLAEVMGTAAWSTRGPR